MFSAVGAMSNKTKDVSFNVHLEEEHKNKGTNKVSDENYDDVEQIELDEDEEEEPKLELDLGPQFSLKEQLEKDKVRFFFFKWFLNFILFVSRCFL
jgi:Rho GDP-dissociation inhibitor